MPGCGRFISEDPIGIAGGPNVYGYADVNPLSNIDPLGLTPCDIGQAFGTALNNNKDFSQPVFGWGVSIPRDGDLGQAAVGPNPLTGNPSFNWRINLNEKYLDQLNDQEARDLYDTVIHELLHGVRRSSRNHGLGRRGDPEFYNEVDRRLGNSINSYLEKRRESCGGG